MKFLLRPLMLAPLALTMSCATRQAAPLQPSNATGPRLIGCAEVTQTRSTVPRTSVELRYDVNTDGRVSAIRVVPNNNAKYASDGTIAAAKSLALTCTYEPATRDGQPVVATLTRWFTVETAEVSSR